MASLLDGLTTLAEPLGMRSALLNEVGKKASAPGARIGRSTLAGLRRKMPLGTSGCTLGLADSFVAVEADGARRAIALANLSERPDCFSERSEKAPASPNCGSKASERAERFARSPEVIAITSTPWSVSFVESTMASGPISARMSFRASAVLAAINFWGPMR